MTRVGLQVRLPGKVVVVTEGRRSEGASFVRGGTLGPGCHRVVWEDSQSGAKRGVSVQGMLGLSGVRAEWEGQGGGVGRRESGAASKCLGVQRDETPKGPEMVFFPFRCGVTEIQGDPREEREETSAEPWAKAGVGTFRFRMLCPLGTVS